MAKYIITFTKEGYIRYTSHLDLTRLLKRAFKKADLDLEHSQGFNPMPKLSLAQPLSLGYESKGEMAEFETKEDIPPEEVLRRLNEQMPPGINITDCRKKRDGEKGLAASCKGADYRILIPYPADNMPDGDIACSFLAQEIIPVMKKTKKSKVPVEINIRPLIHSMEIEIADNILIMSTHLYAGSNSNLSPELLLQAFFTFTGVVVPRETIEITREKLHM